jgi:hypothetical protein
VLFRVDTYPSDLPINPVAMWLGTCAAHSDNGIVVVASYFPHAVSDAENTLAIRVTCMCAFVREDAHGMVTV